MARKRRSFLFNLQSPLISLLQWISHLLQRFVLPYQRLVAIGLLSLFLTVTITPGLSQQFSTHPQQLSLDAEELYRAEKYDQAVIKAEEAAVAFDLKEQHLNAGITRINLGQMWAELGNQVQACKTLTGAIEQVEFYTANLSDQFFSIFPQLCEDKQFTVEKLQAVLAEIGTQSHESEKIDIKQRVQSKGLQVLGDTLRAIGKLQESKLVLDRSFNLASELSQDLLQLNEYFAVDQLKGAALLSLANTYRAQGDLERDRRSKSRYEYIPWEHPDYERFPESEACYLLASEYYKQLIFEDSQEDQKEQVQYPYPEALKIQAQINQLSLLVQRSKFNFRGEVLTSCLGEHLQEGTRINLTASELKDEVGKLLLRLKLSEYPNNSGTLKFKDFVTPYMQINLVKNIFHFQQLSDITLPQQNELDPLVWLAIYDPEELLSTEVARLKVSMEEFENQHLKAEDQQSFTKTNSESKTKYILSYALGNLAGLYEYRVCETTQDKKCIDTSKAKQQSEKVKQKSEKVNTVEQCQTLPEENLPDYCEQFQQARELTEEALYYTQPEEAPEIAYQWQWQMGRLTAQAQKSSWAAIPYYKSSLETLDLARRNLLIVNSDAQFSFRDNVEPVYRELIDLLLQSDSTEANRNEARLYFDELQLAELENLLQCRLPRNIEKSLDQLVDQENSTLAIYPIILKDRLEVIVKVPSAILNSKEERPQLIRIYSKSVSSEEIEKKIDSFRARLLMPWPDSKTLHRQSKLLYSWLIQPIETDQDLNLDEIKNLVFVLDGSFRQIPMAALYDGSQYLIEKYAIALSPGLNIPASTTNQAQLKLITAGLTERVKFEEFGEFSDLPFADDEVRRINEKIQASNSSSLSIISENMGFKPRVLKEKLERFPYNAVHLVTHGQFSSDPNQTFVIASPNNLLSLNELENIFETSQIPVELLILSACQTAQGDNRAILGLSGITLRAGVRSSIGTLWDVDDFFATQFMSIFYEKLTSDESHLTISEALQETQKVFLRGENIDEINSQLYVAPLFWAPYILIGNWSNL